MRVGILGSGAVGQALGQAFAQKGHDVVLGTKNPGKPELAAWQRSVGPNAALGTFPEAAAHGELVVLCCLGSAALTVIDLAGPARFDAKILIDVTNPLDFSKGNPPGLFVGTTDSLGEQVQHKLPRARVVKCFNVVPNSVMANPNVGGEMPDMMIAGNDPTAKSEVVSILRQFGWPGAIDVGGIEGARWLEALVPLWVRVASSFANFRVAFKVLR